MSEMPTTPRYFFIRRPIVAAVISIIIALLGFFTLQRLPVNQYPQITPPAIQVTTVYPGATAQDVASAVAAPIEQQLSSLQGLLYFNSTNASDGTMNLSIYFDISRDQDLAAVDVQNAISIATPQLPAAVRQNGITVTKVNTALLFVMSLTSDDTNYDDNYLTNYIRLYIQDEVKRVPGVGDALIPGNAQFSMLLSLDPDKMAQLGVTFDDVQQAVAAQNATKPAGRLGREPSSPTTELTLPITTTGRFTTPEQFGNIIVRAKPDGSFIRVSDIGKVRLGSQSYDIVRRVKGKRTALLVVFSRPNANALEVRDAVLARMGQLAKSFPVGVHWTVPFDTTPFITASIGEVIETLVEAMLLVILVVFLFLQSWRATIIPLLAVPVSIIGTFLGLSALGFTVNTLTLFGLVLAIGIVVDDAIVVIENVERIMAEEHLSPPMAADKAMGQVSGALIAIVLVLCAVFVPIGFVGGITGAMYKQFAMTIVISVLLSGIVALTLTPALCAMLLKHSSEETNNRFFRGFNKMFGAVTRRYTKATGGVITRPGIWLPVFGVIIILIVVLYQHVPGGFIPSEDKGYFGIAVQLPDGASLNRTEAVIAKVEDVLRHEPNIQNFVAIGGQDPLTGAVQTNAAVIYVMLKPWDERKSDDQSVTAILARVNRKMYAIKEMAGFAFNLPEVRGLGTTSGLQLNLQQTAGDDYAAFATQVQSFVRDANQLPELQGIASSIRADVPQIFVTVDEDAAYALGVDDNQIFGTLQSMFSNLYVNDFNLYGHTFRVQLEAQPQFRLRPEDIGRYYVRSKSGKMIPLSALVHTDMRGGPTIVSRFNAFSSALVTGTPKPGFSSGEMLDAVERLVKDKYSSQGIGFAYSGESYQQRASEGQSGLVIVLGLILVFLVLAALYESWSIPFAVLFGVPFGVFGALVGVWARGMPNDIYFQVGIFTVIALAAKNAILIVEFATDLRRKGYTIRHAAIEAARERLRPILMTSFAFIFGVVPLLIASGAGAASRHSIGTGVFFGMLTATLVGIFFIPLFFTIIRRISDKEKDSGIEDPEMQKGHDTGAGIMPIIFIGAALSTLYFAGCAVGPNYTPAPPVPSDETLHSSVGSRGSRALFDSLDQQNKQTRLRSPQTADTPLTRSPLQINMNADTARFSWSDIIHDTTLVRLINAALQQNLDVQTAAARISEYRAEAGVASAPLYPNISVTAGGIINRTEYTSAYPAFQFAAVNVLANLTWELDFWGRVRRGAEAANAGAEAQEAAQREAVLSLVSDVTTGYLQLLELDNERRIEKATYESREATLALAQERFNEGVVSALDVAQFKAEVSAPAVSYAQTERQISETEHNLSVLLGESPGHIYRTGSLESAASALDIPDSIPAKLIMQRPDVQESERYYAAATAEIGAAEAAQLPSLAITGNYGAEAASIAALPDDYSRNYLLTAGVSIPIFTGGLLSSQADAARARADEARAQYQKTTLNALRDVDDALVNVRSARDLAVAQTSQALALRQALKLALERYQNGLASYLDILDAQRSLFSAELALSQSQLLELVSAVQLYKALGGTWK